MIHTVNEVSRMFIWIAQVAALTVAERNAPWKVLQGGIHNGKEFDEIVIVEADGKICIKRPHAQIRWAEAFLASKGNLHVKNFLKWSKQQKD